MRSTDFTGSFGPGNFGPGNIGPGDGGPGPNRFGPGRRGPGGHGGQGGHGGKAGHGGGKGGRGGGRGRGGGPDFGPEDVPWGGRGRRGGRGGRGFGRPGGWQQSDLPPADDAESWFTGRLPQDWFSAVEVSVDREEIIVIGTIADTDDLNGAEADGRIGRFRADSRETRMQIADEAQERYQRKVSWGVRAGDSDELFTHISVPVMTRLKQPERQVLDTLVDAGVARSRSEALSWAVKLVGEHTGSWLTQLREAMSEVDKLRSEGPAGSGDTEDAPESD